jgi:hypothetical protein
MKNLENTQKKRFDRGKNKFPVCHGFRIDK